MSIYRGTCSGITQRTRACQETQAQHLLRSNCDPKLWGSFRIADFISRSLFPLFLFSKTPMSSQARLESCGRQYCRRQFCAEIDVAAISTFLLFRSLLSNSLPCSTCRCSGALSPRRKTTCSIKLRRKSDSRRPWQWLFDGKKKQKKNTSFSGVLWT